MRAKDIAKQLGLSAATVSLVLNNKPGVSVNTRQRILDAIAESDFNPQKFPTVNIPSSETKNICFLVFKRTDDDVIEDSQFLSNVIKGLGTQASEHNFSMSISYINDSAIDDIQPIIESIKDGNINGLLILATEMRDSDLIKLFEYANNLPVVLLDRYTSEYIDSISLDNITAMRRATEELIAKGHTEIGFINSSFWLYNFEERLEGMKQALKKHSLNFNKQFYCELTPTIEEAKNDMEKYLNTTKKLPTAFVAANDVLAIGACSGLKEMGYKIPDDISIIGFDDLPYSSIIDPPLSTVKVQKERMGRLAMSRLINLIESDLPERTMLQIRSEIILRGSIAQPATSSSSISN